MKKILLIALRALMFTLFYSQLFAVIETDDEDYRHTLATPLMTVGSDTTAELVVTIQNHSQIAQKQYPQVVACFNQGFRDKRILDIPPFNKQLFLTHFGKHAEIAPATPAFETTFESIRELAFTPQGMLLFLQIGMYTLMELGKRELNPTAAAEFEKTFWIYASRSLTVQKRHYEALEANGPLVQPITAAIIIETFYRVIDTLRNKNSMGTLRENADSWLSTMLDRIGTSNLISNDNFNSVELSRCLHVLVQPDKPEQSIVPYTLAFLLLEIFGMGTMTEGASYDSTIIVLFGFIVSLGGLLPFLHSVDVQNDLDAYKQIDKMLEQYGVTLDF